MQGEQRLTDLAVYHADLLISAREARWEKSAAYEDERPGLAIGHFSVNAMYLPESVGGLAAAPVPASDLGAIGSVLGAPESTGAQAGPGGGRARSSNGQVAAPAIARTNSVRPAPTIPARRIPARWRAQYANCWRIPPRRRGWG